MKYFEYYLLTELTQDYVPHSLLKSLTYLFHLISTETSTGIHFLTFYFIWSIAN